MPEKQTMSDQLRTMGKTLTLQRGNLGSGKKASTKRGAMSHMSQYWPVDTHFYDDVTDERTILTVQNVDAILDNNQAQMNSGHDGYTPSRDLKKVASIPLVIANELLKKGINIMLPEDWPKIASMLDSKDWEKFRTATGKIARKPYRDLYSIGKTEKKAE